MQTIVFPENSVRNFHSTLRKTPKQGVYNLVYYRVIKKSLRTCWLQNTYFMPHYLAQSDWLAADRQGQGVTRLTLTPSVIPNSNYVITVSVWNYLKYFCSFLYCDHQVRRNVWSPCTLFSSGTHFMHHPTQLQTRTTQQIATAFRLQIPHPIYDFLLAIWIRSAMLYTALPIKPIIIYCIPVAFICNFPPTPAAPPPPWFIHIAQL
jgi:hypothetical protein